MDNSQFSINALSASTCSIKKFSGADEVIEIPATIEKDGNQLQVVEIGAGAFKKLKIKSVVIPEGVTLIRDDAFSGCDQLESIKLPSTLVEIKDSAFYGCFKLDGVVLPEGVAALGTHCFEYCKALSAIALPGSLKLVGSKAFANCENMTTLTIAEGVEEIKDGAFNECKITEVTLPSSLKKVEKRAFNNCSSLTTVTLTEEVWSIVDSNAFNGCPSVTLNTGAAPAKSEPEAAAPVAEAAPATSATNETVAAAPESDNRLYHIELVSDTECRIATYKGDEKVVNIPAEFSKGNKTYKVVEIGEYAFAKKKTPGKIVWTVESKNEVTIELVPSAVDESYKGYETIKEVIVPEGVKTIGKIAFYGCAGLEKIQLPKSLEKIDEGAFAFCTHLKSVELPDGVTVIPAHTFENCEGLESFSSKGVKEIKRNAFTACRVLKNLSLPQNVSIETDAFLACSYMEQNKVASDGANMAMFKAKAIDGSTCVIAGFEGEGDVVIPAEMQIDGKTYKVTTINGYAFAKKKKLEKVILPSTIEEIADYAFSESSITEIEIPGSVKTIKNFAFDDCKNLVRLTIGDGVTTLGRNVFSGCSSLKSVRVPNSVKEVAENMFFKCTSLEEVQLPENLEAIGRSAFGNCSSLANIELPKHVGKIAVNAFYDSKCVVDDREFMELTSDTCALTNYNPKGDNVTLQDAVYLNGTLHTVVKIGEYAFMEKKMQSVVLPSHVEALDKSAFSNCKNLTVVAVPSTLKVVGELAFASCESLKEINLPESVTTIMDKAFSGCSNLEKASVPGVTEFKKRAFANCSKLTTLSGLQSNVVIGEEAFLNCKALDLSAPGSNSASGESASLVMLEMKPIDGSTCAISGFKGDGDVTVPAEMQKDGKTYKVVKIKEYAFAKSKKLQKVVLPDSVESIGDYAFSESSLTEIVIPGSVKEIKPVAFDDCKNLVKVTLSEGLEKLSKDAFSGCSSLTSIAIPEGIKTIEKGTFSNCKSLVEVKLPASVEKIEEKAFARCEKLENVNFDHIYNIEPGAFDQTPLANVCRKFEIIDADTCAVVRFGSNMNYTEIPASVTLEGKTYNVVRINRQAFAYKHDQKVIIPSSVEEIEEEAFCDCRDLKEVQFTDGLKTIGLRAFMGCEKLEVVFLPFSVQNVGEYAFANCENLAALAYSPDLTLNENVTENCPKLKPEEEEVEEEPVEEEQEEELANPYEMARQAREEAEPVEYETKGGTKVRVIEVEIDPIDEENCVEKAKELFAPCEGYSDEADSFRRKTELQLTAEALQKAAAKGNVDAMYYLGQYYWHGYGIRPDHEKAAKLYSDSAELGNSDAMLSLYVCLLVGDGTPKDNERAVTMLTMSANHGNATAQKILALKLIDSKEYEEGFMWLRKAADQGQAEAQFNMGYYLIQGIGIEKDEEAAIEWLLKSAESNYCSAQYYLYICYAKGIGVEKDIEVSGQWLVKAAENEYPKAKMDAAYAYYNGTNGLEQNYEEAVRWFRDSAEHNCNNDARYHLGNCLLHGIGVDEDAEEAAQWFEEAAQEGHLNSCAILGYLYMEGNGVDQDNDKAFELFSQAAPQGNAMAQCYLGWCYANEIGTELDYNAAVEWFEKAAENGYEQANEYIGVYRQMASQTASQPQIAATPIEEVTDPEECYQQGAMYFGKADYKNAVAFFEKAANMGHMYGKFYLGTCYQQGVGVGQDIEKAIQLYTESGDAGNIGAYISVAQIYDMGTGIEADHKKAAQYFAKLPMVPYASYRLGMYYYQGDGVEQDYAKAFQLLSQSESGQFGEAFYYLGECYANGYGTDKDEAKAAECFAKAKSLGYEG